MKKKREQTSLLGQPYYRRVKEIESMGKTPSAGFFYRWMKKLNPRISQNYQKGIGPTRIVMLLTTTGRKSGLPRVTPLQYEEIEGIYYVGSARGARADWYRNIQANPQVEVQICQRRFHAVAEPVSDPTRIADFLTLRMKRHPVFIGLLMRLEGLPLRFCRADLERFAATKSLVIIRPVIQA
jgi:deazaflavin-dependent oxidoreductase (nitroreductase family)